MEKLNIPQNLYKQYLMGKYCDLQIQVENSYFRAHSCVVAAASWVLEAILQSSTAEDANLSKLSIQLHGVTAQAISSLLNFIYTGRFPPEMYSDVDKRRDVLHAAKLYKMEEVPKEFETSSSTGPGENGSLTNLQMLESGNLNDSLLETLVPSGNENNGKTAGDGGTVILEVDQYSSGGEEQISSETEKLPDEVILDHVSKNVSYAKTHGILYCVICSKIFSKQTELLSHMTEHKPGYRKRPERAASSMISFAIASEDSFADFGDDFADEDYNSPKRKRVPKRAFTCAECGATYSGKVYLIKHYNTRHPGSLYCKYCAERFDTEEDLQVHVITHGADIKQEEESTAAVKMGGARTKKTKPKGRQGYTCNLCSTSFMKRKELTMHQQNLHGIIKPMHVCTLCGKEFKEKASLRAHTRVHTGEKPYMCSYCGNSFADAKTWKDHERRHRGEKPFLCTTCGKSFTYRQSFTRHMKFHEGKRPFQCSFCGKAFVLRQNLKEHEKRHNK